MVAPKRYFKNREAQNSDVSDFEEVSEAGDVQMGDTDPR
jgi:hypothetical protein